MDESEKRWYAQLHERWTTPGPVIDAAVDRAAGRVASRSRVIAGEGNEVWSVSTMTGDRLIVRISHGAGFASERRAMELFAVAGVPVPEVLLVEDDVDTGDKRVGIWIHRYVEGDRLDTDDPAVVEHAGEILARIHSVQTPDGRLSSDTLAWGDASRDALVASGGTHTDLERAESIMSRLGLDAPDRLLHGDWLPEHVLVREGRVVAVIDPAPLRGDPAYDLAYWNFFDRTTHLAPAELLDGYRRHTELPGDLPVRLHAYTLAHSMRLIVYFHAEGRHRWAQHCARRFAEALAWLRAHT